MFGVMGFGRALVDIRRRFVKASIYCRVCLMHKANQTHDGGGALLCKKWVPVL